MVGNTPPFHGRYHSSSMAFFPTQSNSDFFHSQYASIHYYWTVMPYEILDVSCPMTGIQFLIVSQSWNHCLKDHQLASLDFTNKQELHKLKLLEFSFNQWSVKGQLPKQRQVSPNEKNEDPFIPIWKFYESDGLSPYSRCWVQGHISQSQQETEHISSIEADNRVLGIRKL